MIRLRTDERSLLNSLSDCEPLNERRLFMPPKRLISAPNAAALLGTILILATSVLAAPKYKVLHAFGKGHDGGGLWGSLALDAKGNLYGETSGGGLYGYGTVFELTPGSAGLWTETILHSFRNNDPDGDDLNGSPVLDPGGNLFGMAPPAGALTPMAQSSSSRPAPAAGTWRCFTAFAGKALQEAPRDR
jgi:uncharacterized repeat protein (TIGR03803 family)